MQEMGWASMKNVAFASAFVAMVLVLGCIGGQTPADKVNAAIPTLENETYFQDVAADDWGAVNYSNFSEISNVLDNVTLETTNVSVVYFYESGCSACATINPLVDRLKAKYNASTTWYAYDIATNDGWGKFKAFMKAYGVPDNESYVPMVFIGNTYGWGIDWMRNQLEDRIIDCGLNGCYSPFDVLASS